MNLIYLYSNWYTTDSAEIILSTNLRNTETTEFNAVAHVTQHIVSENNSTRDEDIRNIFYKLSLQEGSS